jgi:hypothetical protein
LDLAIENIIAAHALCPRSSGFQGVIFAFGSPNRLDTIIRNLKEYPVTTQAPTAILLFDKDVIIYRYGWLRHFENVSKFGPEGSIAYPYAVRRGKSGHKGGIVITFLLLLFFDAIRARGLLQSIPPNALIAAMEEHTELVRDDVHIGPLPSSDGS